MLFFPPILGRQLLFKMADLTDPDFCFHKLASFAKRELFHDSTLRPSASRSWQDGFEKADCVHDFEMLVKRKSKTEEEHADDLMFGNEEADEARENDKAFEWYEIVYGTWYQQNQRYAAETFMRDMVNWVNLRGEIVLNKDLSLDDTEIFRRDIDELLDGDCRGDAADSRPYSSIHAGKKSLQKLKGYDIWRSVGKTKENIPRQSIRHPLVVLINRFGVHMGSFPLTIPTICQRNPKATHRLSHVQSISVQRVGRSCTSRRRIQSGVIFAAGDM